MQKMMKGYALCKVETNIYMTSHSLTTSQLRKVIHNIPFRCKYVLFYTCKQFLHFFVWNRLCVQFSFLDYCSDDCFVQCRLAISFYGKGLRAHISSSFPSAFTLFYGTVKGLAKQKRKEKGHRKWKRVKANELEPERNRESNFCHMERPLVLVRLGLSTMRSKKHTTKGFHE